MKSASGTAAAVPDIFLPKDMAAKAETFLPNPLIYHNKFVIMNCTKQIIRFWRKYT
jgi:hypothetical protein